MRTFYFLEMNQDSCKRSDFLRYHRNEKLELDKWTHLSNDITSYLKQISGGDGFMFRFQTVIADSIEDIACGNYKGRQSALIAKGTLTWTSQLEKPSKLDEQERLAKEIDELNKQMNLDGQKVRELQASISKNRELLEVCKIELTKLT